MFIINNTRCKFPLKCTSYLSYTKINSNDQLDLLGSCLSNCNGINMTYNFTLFYSAQNDINAIIDQWVQFNLSSYYLTAGQEKGQLKIKKQLFSDYPFKFWKVQLTGDLIYSANLTLQGDSSNEFLVNCPPANGECDVDPKNGNTSDVFSFNCSNWMDSVGFVTNYVFMIRISMN